MAAIVATSLHSSSHGFPPHRSDFTAFPQHLHRRGPATSDQNPFEAFAPHHHSGPNSRSAAASWRHSEPVLRTIPDRTLSTKYHRSGASHSGTHSTFDTTWCLQIYSPTPKPDGKHFSFLYCDFPLTIITASELHPKVSSLFVYSIAELLRLSTSPLVGINKESQAVVDDLVAHHVWRRGPQSRQQRVGDRRKSRDISQSRYLHVSSASDDSGQSD
jgi:hypothetical protein